MADLLHAYTIASQVVQTLCYLGLVFPLALDPSAGLVGTSDLLVVYSLRVEQAFFSLSWMVSELGAPNLVPGLARVPDLLPFDGRQVVEAALQQQVAS